MKKLIKTIKPKRCKYSLYFYAKLLLKWFLLYNIILNNLILKVNKIFYFSGTERKILVNF